MRLRQMAVVTAALALMLGWCGCGKPSAESNDGAPTGKVRYAKIGTGGMTGVYYPTGGAIAKMVNDQRDKYGIRCNVESTGGSVYNVNALLSGDLTFGIVQSDIQYQAYNGQGKWETRGPQQRLRSVFAIHPELVTLVAAVDADIKDIKDLRGKSVNIGDPGSGNRQNAIAALKAVGLNYKSDIRAQSVKAAEAPSLLQDEKIDAFFYTVGHPSGAVKEASTGRKVRFASITGVDELVASLPYFAKSHIPVKLYERVANEQDVPTFGVKATLVTVDTTPADMVYAITKEVFANLEAFKLLHPAYTVLTRENMMEGLSAPLHPGAERYFREAGLLKE